VRRRPLLLGTIVATLAVVVIVIGGAEPAFADNCSGLSDCSPSLLAGTFLLGGVLGLGILAAASSAIPPGGGSAGGSGSGGGGPGSGGGSGSSGGSPPGANPPSPPVPPTAPPAYDPNNLPPKLETTPEQQKAINDAQQRIANDLQQGKGPQTWAKDINPTGDKLNCVESAKAVDQTLANNPSSAGPVSRGQNGAELQSAYPGRPDADSTADAITQDLLKSGPGSRGIVTVYEDGSAHAVNVYNDHGRVVWIDGQSGTVSNSANGVLRPAGYTDHAQISVIKTYP
jgi:hypothetical protein